MNEILLTSKAEQMAEKAENLNSFSGLKLLHVKKQVALILGQIGKEGIFDEYTKHDISHIDFMLDSLEWIIPEETQDKLTSANWLMLTLSIYFHDLGMLVTKQEFRDRKKSSFPTYKQSILDGKFGLDYRDKILGLSSEEAQDRFMYQELVRRTHAERIKFWILNETNPNFQSDLDVVVEIKKLISNIDYMFRRDLALICESHHLSDLDDFDKYKPNQQYGTSKDEIVNLHYSALILRTADLLHITSDRTPSIEFNLINPTDPVSQDEWAKQRAVKTIRPQIKKNKEGVADDNIPKDTLEIIALFEEEKGFFGLVSYINYANKQLKENNKYNEVANKQFGNTYGYPWRNIDDSNIETKDFEKRQFEFVLDQTKILDLLVGHTLYNDPTVVLRELTQNGIDASKLKKHELTLENSLADYNPEIKIKWAEKCRELSFIDNGTGMTLEIIENHLLKVGSSRYQDEGFKKKYPDFSPISRFGIGLLTCFLIADDIDILTKSGESEKAILLKIKKIHGKYLLQYLSIDKVPDEIRKHGTEIKLYVRADVKLKNIEKELKKWILIPNCKLSLQVDEKVIPIGFTSPKEVLETHLKDIGFDIDEKHLKVKEIKKDGLTIAFALRYIEHWKEWDFLEYNEVDRNNSPIGTCIEGIKVDFNSPGFNGRNIYAIVNTSGRNAPKTNVARSNIEITPEREALLFSIYQLYLEHISGELESLRKIGFSITWAANEASWLLDSFTRNSRYSARGDIKIEDFASFEKALSKIQCVLIEKNGKRDIISINDLKELTHFWSIDCASYSSADSLIKEVKSSNTSALALLETIFGTEDSNTDHIDYLLCNLQSNKTLDKIIRNNFQVDFIKLIPEQRRLDLRWSITKDKIWEEIILTDDDYNYSRTNTNRCFIQLRDFEIDKSISQIAINSSDALFILKNSELNSYIVKLIDKLADKSPEDRIALSQTVSLLNSFFYYGDIDKTRVEELIQSRFQRKNNRDMEQIVWSRIDREELIGIILKTNFIKYDNTIWYRRGMY